MDIEEVAMLAAGCVALLAGLGVIVFRDATAKRNQGNGETKLGEWFPGLSSESTPANGWSGNCLSRSGRHSRIQISQLTRNADADKWSSDRRGIILKTGARTRLE